VFCKSLIESRFKNSQRITDENCLWQYLFQTYGAENRKARLEKSVLMNGLFSSGMVAERNANEFCYSAV